MKIIEVNEFSSVYLDAIRKLVCLLTSESILFTEADFRELLTSDNSRLFLLLVENHIAGMLTVGIYRSPTGTKAWIEDVAVDEAYQGKGFGKILTQHAIDYAKSQRADILMLTSNPLRIVANRLYQTIGFERKETNVYRMRF